jgi:hypothetical protein
VTVKNHLDYAWWRPASMKALTDDHVASVGRYIGQDTTGKNLTRAEAAELHKAGIAVWLSFEFAAEQPANGHVQGVTDGLLAIAQYLALGIPPGRTVYFSADWDVPDYAPSRTSPRAKLGPVGDYLAGVASVDPPFQIGIYGGYWPVSRALTAGLVAKAWQTDAWSGGRVDKRIAIHQTGGMLFGGNADRNRVLVEDYGQWPGPAAKPKTKIALGHEIASGKQSLHAVAAAHPGNVVSTILRLTAENSESGFAGHGLSTYINAGDWDAPLPKGQELWYYHEVPA